MLTGAQIALESLIREGVDTIFGYPGGANLWLYRYLPDYPAAPPRPGAPRAGRRACRRRLRAQQARRRSAWSSRPAARARSTWSPGSPPPTWTRSRWSRSPARCRRPPSGPTASRSPTSSARPCRWSSTRYLITRVEDIAPTIKEAFHIARTGRPGPVLIDFPKDLQAAITAFNYPEGPVRRRSYPAPPRPDPAKLRQIAELIEGAKRPVILAGRGVLIAGAEEELAELAHQAHIPVGWTLLGTGAFPVTDPMALQMVGLHGRRLHQQGGLRRRRADHGRDALRRPGHHPARLVRAPRRAPRAHRHRPRRDRQERRSRT